MKLIQLQAYKEVMETGTVTEAAKSLKCGQPRVSRLLSELEDEIGFKLFRRQKQRLYATEEGKIFYQETERMLLGIKNIEQIADDIYNKRATGIRVLAQSHIAHGLLNQAFGEFDKSVKNIRYDLVVKPRKQLSKWLGGHQFDLAFTILPAQTPLVRQVKLLSVKLLVALPNGHPLGKKDHITIEDLSTTPLIALPKGLLRRQYLDKLFDNSGFHPDIRIETPTAVSACQLVSQGLGATLTEPFTASIFSKDDFVLRPLIPEFNIEYAVLYLKHDQPRRLVRKFIDVSRNVAKDINEDVSNRLLNK